MAVVYVIITFIITIIFYPIIVSSASEYDALIKLKSSLSNTDSLNSWEPESEPCAKDKKWNGLICNKAGNVYGLRLEKMGLSGIIDVDALSELQSLRTISFQYNDFTGSIPELNRIGVLKNIYLSGNGFSGEIPDDFFKTMHSLKKIWLDDNKFSGEIPSSLGEISHLLELHLENNQFSGSIPSFEKTALTSFNVTNNKLQGEVPTSLDKFTSTSFTGNDGLCGGKTGKECEKTATLTANPPPEAASDTADKANHEDSSNINMKYGIMVASALILGLVTAAILLMKKREEHIEIMEKEYLDDSVNVRINGDSRRGGSVIGRRGSSHGDAQGELTMVNEEKGVYTLNDLMQAAAEMLGNGCLGSSYKAVMPNGFSIVVKRIKDLNKIGRDGFEAEITRFGKFKHKNILPPLAYNYKKDDKLFVFEFISKGSLLFLLHGDRGQAHADLSWPIRRKIIKGIASGLGYLHKELSTTEIPHGNLKSSNVLLTENYEPLLADFGFNAFMNNSQAPNILFAYKSPEVTQQRNISPKCDVYCLGIIILEVVTGKYPSQYLNNGNGGTDVIQWAKTAIQEGREVDLFDPDISGFKEGHDEMTKMIQIGCSCTESNPNKRLELRDAIRRIEEVDKND